MPVSYRPNLVPDPGRPELVILAQQSLHAGACAEVVSVAVGALE
jgi:hypothetical protein